jgi:hypothetical protein
MTNSLYDNSLTTEQHNHGHKQGRYSKLHSHPPHYSATSTYHNSINANPLLLVVANTTTTTPPHLVDLTPQSGSTKFLLLAQNTDY